jgi:hypothetical protein
LSGQEALEILKAGTYDVIDEKKEAILSLNYDRLESSTDCFTKSEILTGLDNQLLKNISFSEIADGQSLTKIDIEKPFEYWRLFLLLALLFIVSEMLVLKFWK